MENLLAFPVHLLEVMIGKILPYIMVGYIQVTVILVAAHFLFSVPIAGSLPMQMTFFYFLPSMLLSGLMFPFRGMPQWAQVIGEGLPLTHFLRIVHGIMLKGNGWAETWPNVWPLLVFMTVVMLIGFKRYRKTLD